MKNNLKNVMTTAWTIRKLAAAKLGCKVSEVSMSECLRLAWKGMEKSLETRVKEHPAVLRVAEFYRPENNIDRLYVTLVGYDKTYSGDRNLKVYLDRRTQQVRIEKGKGTTTRAIDTSLEVFARDLGAVRI